MKFKELCHSFVLVAPDSIEQVSKGGIHLPASAQAQQQPTGTVLMVGPGKENNPMGVQPGDRVLYGQCNPFKLDDNQPHHGEGEHHMMDMMHIVAIVEPR